MPRGRHQLCQCPFVLFQTANRQRHSTIAGGTLLVQMSCYVNVPYRYGPHGGPYGFCPHGGPYGSNGESLAIRRHHTQYVSRT